MMFMQPNQVLSHSILMHLIHRAENDKRASSAQSLIAKVGQIKIYIKRDAKRAYIVYINV